MNCRKNVKFLGPDEKAALVQAFIDLKDSSKAPSLISDAQDAGADSRYDDYIWVHTIVNLGAHRRPAFLAWHRKFLDLLEADLQDVSGDPTLALPYWDWSDPAGSNPFTSDFLGGEGVGSDGIVEDGAFAHSEGDWELTVPPEGGAQPGPELRRGTVFGSSSSQEQPSPEEVLELLNVTPLDTAPWDDGVNTDGFRNRVEGWFGAPPVRFHNAGHVFVGGSMLPDNSPQDPVFWLHHANIDRLWAIWRQKHPSEPYVPGSGESSSLLGHRLGDNMALFGDYFGSNYTIDSVLDHQAAGYMYDTDIPSVTLDTPSIDFGSVPEGMTTYHAIRFRVETCRQVSFEIENAPTGNFGLTPVSIFTADPVPGDPFVYGYVFVAYTAPSAGAQESSSVTIRSYFTDTEGYYSTNPGDQYDLLTETIDIFATPINMQQTAVALVLDRSGSMNGTATINSGGLPVSKFNLLQDAVSVFSDLMRPEDGVGVVSYDDVTDRLANISKMGPYLPINPGSGRDNINTILSGPDLDPRGLTGIGAAILEGNDLLNDGQAAAVTPYDHLALVVMTDGNENQSPTIMDVEPSISAHTFSVGLGTAGNVSEPALELIAQNNDGELLVTGDMSSQVQQFFLTKLFVQVLAGITNQDIILDPHGNLVLGATHRIPFSVTEADVDLDILVLSDFSELIEFCFELPDGTIIKPKDVVTIDNVTYIGKSRMSLYRMRLPAISNKPEISHGGQWHAILKFDEKRLKNLLQKENRKAFEFLRSKSKSIAYDVIVQTRSNLNMKANVVQKSFEPGAEVELLTEFRQYNQSLQNNAQVRAEIKDQNGTITSLKLERVDVGKYRAFFVAKSIGVHTIRILATGRTNAGDRFTREKVLSVSTFKGGDSRPIKPGTDTDLPGKGILREILNCIMENKVIDERFYERMKEWGIDVKTILECIKKHSSQKTKASFDSEKQKLSADRITKRTVKESGGINDDAIQMINKLLIQKDMEKETSKKGKRKAEDKKEEKIKKPELGHIPSEGFYTKPLSKKSKKGK